MDLELKELIDLKLKCQLLYKHGVENNEFVFLVPTPAALQGKSVRQKQEWKRCETCNK